MTTSFNALTDSLKNEGKRRKIIVVEGADHSTLSTVGAAIRKGFAAATFVGRRADAVGAEEIADVLQFVDFEETAHPESSARRAVELVREGRGDILMKGLISTDTLLRAVLSKECGLLPAGKVLSHIAAASIPGFDRLLFFTDAAVIPHPTHEQRLAMVGYAAELCHKLGISRPRIALTHCSEKVSEKFPHTLGCADIIERGRRGEWGEVVIDGPLDVRTSVDAEGCRIKGIKSPLEGRADVLVFPDIEAGNTFYKTISYFLDADMAGMLVGTICPVVLPSRADNERSKFCSLILASAAALP